MSEKKALFFDVDGTLISELDGTLPQSAVKAIAEARKRGHLTLINSGRVFKLLEPIREVLAMDGYLCGCGTYIVVDGREIYARTIPHQRGQEIKQILQQHGMEGILEGKGGCHLRRETSLMEQLEKIRQSLQRIGALSPYTIEDDHYDFDKFCCVSDENSDVEGFIRKLPDFEVIDRGHDFWECVPKGHSKATAMEKVLEYYGLERKDAYVFGDSMNDLAMFAYAENAVLMGEHDKGLEEYATLITRRVEEDGIAYAMKKLGIIEGAYYHE